MSIQATYTDIVMPKNDLVWQLQNREYIGSTGESVYCPELDNKCFFHSDSLLKFIYSGTVTNFIDFNINKQFIAFEHTFKTQFENLKEYFDGVDYNEAHNKFITSLTSLLEASPDAFSMELTSEQSIFYTIKKADYTFFIQHFLNTADDDDDEAILTLFKGNDKLPSFAGSLSETIFELNNVLLANSTLEFELHEVPY